MSCRDDGSLDGVTTVRAILVTPRPDRLLAFYVDLLGAREVERMPAEGPAFYVGLRLGDSDLGVVADDAVDLGAPQRMLLSIEVPDVDALLDRVAELGGTVLGPPNDMPWGQRVVHLQDPDGNTVNLTQEIGSAA
jgi:predicted enzyme related to lactoylglutathione lyase